MSRITSCLTSHASLRDSFTEDKLKSSSVFTEKGGLGRAEKLSSTRKELKNLIKIQQKHGKLLNKLQTSGLVTPDATSLGESHMNFTLLNQMQNVFKQLAQIQSKLDREAAEEAQRRQAVQPYLAEYC